MVPNSRVYPHPPPNPPKPFRGDSRHLVFFEAFPNSEVAFLPNPHRTHLTFGDDFGASLGGIQAPSGFWKVPGPPKILPNFPGRSLAIEEEGKAGKGKKGKNRKKRVEKESKEREEKKGREGRTGRREGEEKEKEKGEGKKGKDRKGGKEGKEGKERKDRLPQMFPNFTESSPDLEVNTSAWEA